MSSRALEGELSSAELEDGARRSDRFATARERLAPLTSRRVPTFVLGALVAIATWETFFAYPTTGLDPSWVGGLTFALQDDLGFGTEIVWTYGPLGFLGFTFNWDTTLATIGFLWLGAQHVAMAWGLIWSLRRTLGALGATVLSYLAIALLPLADIAFPLAAVLCYAALRPERSRFAVPSLAVGGALFAAIFTLTKLSIGPPVFVMFALALIGARASARMLALYAGTFLAAFLALWLLSGQSLADIPDYLSNGRQIISGYSEAMFADDGRPVRQLLLLAAVAAAALILLGGAAFSLYRDQRARTFGTLVAAAAAFAVFKEGAVRLDAAHFALALSTFGLLWLVLPWRSRARIPLVAAAIALSIAGSIATREGVGGSVWDGFRVKSTVEQARAQLDALVHPGQRTAIADFAVALMRDTLAVDPGVLAEIEGHSVSVEPFEIAAVDAYGFDWAPLPVMQGYSAYTAELDRLNAAEVASPSGPERILRGSTPTSPGQPPAQAIDGRYRGWDPPAQALAEVCNFVPLAKEGSWQALGRVPNRCGEPVLIDSVDSAYGQTVDVPAAGPGEVVFVRIEGAEVSGLESLRTLLYRAQLRFAVVEGGRSYRLVPGTAGDGLMLRGDPRVVGRGRFARAPQTSTLELTGPTGDLRYDFYSMKVALPPTSTSRRRSPR